ncbi:hypothetical protein CANARDRAFT_29693 [[Candida] arabinofermentans NRRL YB-2248]|uniref:CP-type G domain-containing protein n=1 Tax=[Candida] arabinofermentans NRRL YB-2248 TaxID=983967 RepID=A0A1E4SW17_9ASCO|nr:hypothetical protein CANARDRAFT_29693 [[Candida] arabinofermentans NRRL YB-2248]
MRVRKATSKRTSTRMREGIQRKAAAHRRKENKLAKKDVTWKSKHKKDMGIPASFPYKDRLISQIEEVKRKETEERLRKRAEKRAAYQNAAAADGDMMMSEGEDGEEEEEEGNGLAALLESAQNAAKKYTGDDAEASDIEEDEDDEDLEIVDYDVSLSDSEDAQTEQDKSRKQYDKIFKAVVDASDVVLYVMDARDPEGTRSRRVEEAVLQNPNKRLILILNKVDLIPENVLKQWLDFLQSSFPTIPLKASNSATNATTFNKKLTQSASSSALLQSLKTYSHKSNLKRAIVVGVIGYPNVGKSSIINALTAKHNNGSSKACPVGNQAGITTSLREVKVDNKLKILDSPGIVFPDSNQKKKNKTQQEAELALLNALPSKQITDPIPAITLLIKRLAKSNDMAESFKKLYQLPSLPSNDVHDFTKQILIHIARKQGRLGKGGIPNLYGAGMTILNDWRDGKIVGWTLPKSSKAQAAQADVEQVKTSSAPATKVTGSVEQTTVVQTWAKEFDLDSLFADVFGK